MKRSRQIAIALLCGLLGVADAAVAAHAQQEPGTPDADQVCSAVTQEHADKSAGPANVTHDGAPLPGVPFPDISKGFAGIPHSAQPPLTASQQRILECSYKLPQANAAMPYTLFVPSTYKKGTPTPLVVDLHGYTITPLMQILFDGTTDAAEKHGLIVVAPMGFSVSAWWGSLPSQEVQTAATNPATGKHFTSGELSELDTMTLLKRIRAQYTIDPDRIYIMGHSMGGMGTYYLAAKYNTLWAAAASLSGVGGIKDDATAMRFRNFPTLILHGGSDSIVSVGFSRRSALHLQNVGAQFVYEELPGKDHEFWIRRGAENMARVFDFFAVANKRNQIGFITPEKVPAFTDFPPPGGKLPVPNK